MGGDMGVYLEHPKSYRVTGKSKKSRKTETKSLSGQPLGNTLYEFTSCLMAIYLNVLEDCTNAGKLCHPMTLTKGIYVSANSSEYVKYI